MTWDCAAATCPEFAIDNCACTYCQIHCDRYCHGVCACAEKKPSPGGLSGAAIRWNRLGLQYPVLAHGGRTSLVDFLDALEAVDQRLVKYEPVKGGAWRKQAVLEHIQHAVVHATCSEAPGLSDLTAAALRALMALQLAIRGHAA